MTVLALLTVESEDVEDVFDTGAVRYDAAEDDGAALLVDSMLSRWFSCWKGSGPDDGDLLSVVIVVELVVEEKIGLFAPNK